MELVRKKGVPELAAAALVAVLGISLLAHAHDPDDLPPEQVGQGSLVAPMSSSAVRLTPGLVQEHAVAEPSAEVSDLPAAVATATLPDGSTEHESEPDVAKAPAAIGIHCTIKGRVLDSRGAPAIHAVVSLYGVIASPKELWTWTEQEVEAARRADEEARRALDDPTRARSASAATLRAIRRIYREELLLELARAETGGDGCFQLVVNRGDVARARVYIAIRDAVDEETQVWGFGEWTAGSSCADLGEFQLGRSGRLTVSVRDHGHPVEASVELLGGYGQLQSVEIETDALGVVVIETPEASADLIIRSEGFATEYRKVDMSCREVRVDVALEPTATISGVVCDADGAPIESAVVLVSEKGEGWGYEKTWGHATTDARGAFTLEGVHAGHPATVEADRPEGSEGDLLPSVMVETTAPVGDLVLRMGKPAHLVVVPELDGDVAELGSDSTIFELRERNGEGRLETPRSVFRVDSLIFGGLFPGTYQLRVTSSWYAPTVSADVKVTAGEVVEVPIRVTRGRRVSGRVSMPGGRRSGTAPFASLGTRSDATTPTDRSSSTPSRPAMWSSRSSSTATSP
jgi:protocatechuate 3,4-dioxygenase beta subunit